jgi:hypothetical protein
MANWYCSSVDYTAVAPFTISNAYTLGQIIRQLATPSVGNERCFRCTTAGTSGASEASWNLSKNATTTQGAAVFTECTGNETYQAAGAWAAPHARLSNAGSGWAATGDTIYVAANHNENTAAGITVNGNLVICVDNSGTGHVPPQSGDARTTAVVTIAGSFNTISLISAYIYGIIFVGSGSFPGFSFGSTSTYIRCDSCAFNALASMAPGFNGTVDWNNTTWTPFSTTNSLSPSVGSIFRWRNTPSAVLGLAVNEVITDAGGVILLDGVDFSGFAHSAIIQGSGGPHGLYQIVNCKLNSATKACGPASGFFPGTTLDMIATDSGSATTRSERYNLNGVLTTSTIIIHTGGASDGTTGTAWAITTGTNTSWPTPFECFPMMIWNAVIGSSKTVSVQAVVNAAAVLNTDQLWLDLEYLGTSGSTLASLGTSTKANILATATAITASTQAWDTQATVRANSHGNVVGDVIAVSSNAGRIFFCTTAGTTSGTLPSGYATAVDGGSVTDGTAVFRAGCRMTVSLAVTPQVAGVLRGTVKIGVASTTCYIDPLLTVV